MLAQKYVEKARDYERADSDCAAIPGTAEQLTFALVAVSRERDEAVAKLRAIIKAYKKSTGGLRTADFHAIGCDCLRCAVDNARVSENS